MLALYLRSSDWPACGAFRCFAVNLAAAKAAALAAKEKRSNLRVLVSGASGFLGKPLVRFLQAKGFKVSRLVRRQAGLPDEIGWDPEKGILVQKQLEDFDAAVHLAGESVFSLRWTKSKKREILESRERSSHLLSETFAHTRHPPKVFVGASAIGYYGDRGEEEIDEASSRGKGFLAEVASRWEAACTPLVQRGTRILHPRFGIILGKGGGSLQKMLLLHRLGLGGPLGGGLQWMSWIALEDAISSIHFALTHPTIEGPYIAASPNPVRQKDFSQELSRHLHRPSCIHWPKWLLRMILGEAADELLLSSVKALPKKLLKEGFHFACPSLDSALHSAL